MVAISFQKTKKIKLIRKNNLNIQWSGIDEDGIGISGGGGGERMHEN